MSQVWLVCHAFARATPNAHNWSVLTVARNICAPPPSSMLGSGFSGVRCLTLREAKLLPQLIRNRVKLVKNNDNYPLIQQPEFRYVRHTTLFLLGQLPQRVSLMKNGSLIKILEIAQFTHSIRLCIEYQHLIEPCSGAIKKITWSNLRCILDIESANEDYVDGDFNSSGAQWGATCIDCIETDVRFTELVPQFDFSTTSVFEHMSNLRVLTTSDYETAHHFFALPQTPNCFPRLEIFGIVHNSETDEDMLSNFFRRCTVMMPCLSCLIIGTYTADFNDATVFREIPITITNVFIGFECYNYDNVTINKSNVLALVQKNLPQHVTCHVHQFELGLGYTVSDSSPDIVQNMQRQRGGGKWNFTHPHFISGKGTLS